MFPKERWFLVCAQLGHRDVTGVTQPQKSRLSEVGKIVELYQLLITHRIHVWYIYANIGGIIMVNVTIYGIHGSYGIRNMTKPDRQWRCRKTLSWDEASKPIAAATTRWTAPRFGSWQTRKVAAERLYFMVENHYSYGHLLVITGYFYGIIHSINGVISTYNW